MERMGFVVVTWMSKRILRNYTQIPITTHVRVHKAIRGNVSLTTERKKN
jgi:hypothetical protein